MVPPGYIKIVTAHPAFINIYRQKLRSTGINPKTELIQGYPKPIVALLVHESQKDKASDIVAKYQKELSKKMNIF